MTTYSTGMNTTDRKVDAIMPPATAVPDRVARAGAGAGRKRERHHPEHERQRRHQNRPEADAPRFERRLDNRQAALAQLLGELDDEDGVLRGQADQHDEAHLAEHVVGQAAHPLRAERAEHGQRHAEQDDEREHPAFILRGEHQIDEDEAQREDVAGLRPGLDLLERLPGPRVIEPGRQRLAGQRPISCSASPELTPGAADPVSSAERNRLKWLMTCGAVTSFTLHDGVERHHVAVLSSRIELSQVLR